jgi:hypothetical protein
MLNNSKIQRLLQNDWVIGGFLLIIFLLSNGYTYAWDDQHVELPLLKSLIDPGLYHGDYYVTDLKQNFTSFLYPILARLITVDQIPTAYFILYLISRYFFFFWMYKLWLVIAKEKRGAFICVLTVILLGRVEEFLYRTFSHQEFAMAIVMAGFYYFYKERFYLAAVLLGIAANFHALYSLFPMLYMLTFLVWQHKKFGWKTFFQSGVIFTIFTSPFLIWTARRFLSATHPAADANWLALYQLACPQNFIFLEIPLQEVLHKFQTFVKATDAYFILLFMFILNYRFHDTFQKDTKVKATALCATGLLIFSFVFSYIIPVRFIVDLNLIRNAQYLLFILVCYTALLVVKTLQEKPIFIGVLTVPAFALLRFGDTIGCLAVIIIFCLLAYSSTPKKALQLISILGIVLMVFLIGKVFTGEKFSLMAIRALEIIVGLLIVGYLLSLALKNAGQQMSLRKVLIFIPYLLFLMNYSYYHYQHLRMEKQGGGFWQLQRNWIEMQNYVKNNTPKTALILIPHDMEMGGFRIFSERPIVMEYRDCGIVGFDYAAAVEWHKRLKELEPFKVFVDGPIEPVIKTAITKYKVNYIVFMNYLKIPSNPVLQEVYHNDVFALYQVKVNPIP